MAEHPVTRYPVTEDGKLIIDISISRYNELFDEWDNTASYIKKDIDADLADFLFDCFDEVKKKDFFIRITVPKKNLKKQEKVKQSIQVYFNYMATKERIKLKNHLRRTFAYLIMGIFFIISSVLIRESADLEKILNEVLVEGMIIIGWVTLWQVTTSVLYEWYDIYSTIKIYERIADTKIFFQKSSHAKKISS